MWNRQEERGLSNCPCLSAIFYVECWQTIARLPQPMTLQSGRIFLDRTSVNVVCHGLASNFLWMSDLFWWNLIFCLADTVLWSSLLWGQSNGRLSRLCVISFNFLSWSPWKLTVILYYNSKAIWPFLTAGHETEILHLTNMTKTYSGRQGLLKKKLFVASYLWTQ